MRTRRLRGGPGTSSRLHPLRRPEFRALLGSARPGDTVHISEMFRLVRGTGHILDVLDALHRDQVALRIHDDAFSAMDLTPRHPRTGELLSTVMFMVQTLAAAGELQRELTYDGLRAAETKGNKGGRRPAVAAAQTADVRAAYLEGRSMAALARDHGVSRGAIRTAVADLLPDHAAIEKDSPAPELGIVAGAMAFARFLTATGVQFAVQRLSRPAILMAGAGSTTVRMITLIVAVRTSSVPVLIASALLAGAGQGIGQRGGVSLLSSSVPPRHPAEANAAL